MKGKHLYVIMVVLALVLHQCKGPVEHVLPSLAETYQYTDKGPFGGYIAYARMMEQLDDRYIENINEPFDVAYKGMSNTDSGHALYLLITKNLITTEDESIAFHKYVSEGNDLFIAADYISANLLTKLQCSTERDSEIVAEVNGRMKLTSTIITWQQKSKYSYYYFPFFNSFSDYRTSAKVLGVNDSNKPNYIVFSLGKGRVYLNAAPRAFSNYFLLKERNYLYLEKVVSFFRPDPKNIYWDEFYKKLDTRRKRTASEKGNGKDQNDRTNNFSSLSVVSKNPALQTAFWLVIIGLLCFVFFNIKRKQRVLHEQPPVTNTTVAFTETVGRLYLQQRNNKNIAEKMVSYFFEHIRNHYFLNTTKLNSEFIVALTRKTGLSAGDVQQLFDQISCMQGNEHINDDQLTELNKQIQHFYKEAK